MSGQRNVNHYAEAVRCLSQASVRRGNAPDADFVNPHASLTLTMQANAHAALAHLPEQQVVAQEQLAEAQRDLATTRRVIGSAAAGAVLSGDRDRHATVWYLVRALEEGGVEVESAIRDAVEQRGGDFEGRWVHPNTGLTDPRTPEGKAESVQLAQVLAVVVRCVWEMSFHHERHVRTWARDLMEQLDGAGANIDDQVGAMSKQRGRGPDLFDLFGFSYDLSRQYVDANGKRWEHTGGWTDLETPVMRRDEPDGSCMALPDLVRERGPLYAITSPPRSAAVGSDEPPF